MVLQPIAIDAALQPDEDDTAFWTTTVPLLADGERGALAGRLQHAGMLRLFNKIHETLGAEDRFRHAAQKRVQTLERNGLGALIAVGVKSRVAGVVVFVPPAFVLRQSRGAPDPEQKLDGHLAVLGLDDPCER